MTGATILGCEGPVLSAQERDFFRSAEPWGFILFARNIDSPDQLRRLTSDLRDTVSRDAPVFVDQEGGRVQRLGPPHWRQWAAPLDQMTVAGGQGARVMWLRYRLIAAELAAVGIDGNCAPVADIAGPKTHPFLRNRCLAGDAASVVWAARAAADALLAGGVLPVIKHIPGHGRAEADSHHALPDVHASLSELEAEDFAVFGALADLPLAMTAHVVYRALDAALPATLSPRVIGAIREGIGFEGLLMSDDISMGALSDDIGVLSRAVRAAGCDLVLHCNGKVDEMVQVVEAAGHLDGASAQRAKAALARRRSPDPVDIGALEAELEAVLSGRS